MNHVIWAFAFQLVQQGVERVFKPLTANLRHPEDLRRSSEIWRACRTLLRLRFEVIELALRSSSAVETIADKSLVLGHPVQEVDITRV